MPPTITAASQHPISNLSSSGLPAPSPLLLAEWTPSSIKLLMLPPHPQGKEVYPQDDRGPSACALWHRFTAPDPLRKAPEVVDLSPNLPPLRPALFVQEPRACQERLMFLQRGCVWALVRVRRAAKQVRECRRERGSRMPGPAATAHTRVFLPQCSLLQACGPLEKRLPGL